MEVLSLSSVSTESSDKSLTENPPKNEPEKEPKIEPEKESILQVEMESKTEFSTARPAWSRNDELSTLQSEPEPEPEPELEVDIEVVGREGERSLAWSTSTK